MGNRVMNGRGLVARFLMAIPASRIGKRIFLSQAIPESAVNGFQSVLESIFLSADNKEMQTIHLSEGARIIIENYFMENEKLLADRANSMKEWLAKNVVAVLLIAGIYILQMVKKVKSLYLVRQCKMLRKRQSISKRLSTAKMEKELRELQIFKTRTEKFLSEHGLSDYFKNTFIHSNNRDL